MIAHKDSLYIASAAHEDVLLVACMGYCLFKLKITTGIDDLVFLSTQVLPHSVFCSTSKNNVSFQSICSI